MTKLGQVQNTEVMGDTTLLRFDTSTFCIKYSIYIIYDTLATLSIILRTIFIKPLEGISRGHT